MNKLDILKSYFGHSRFRENQEAIIDAILDGKDALMLLPTGGGKSLCYQLPALMKSGVAIVISPLLALMHDQVLALQSANIKAKMLSSMQSLQEAKEIEQELLEGKIKLLYVAPERLLNEYFFAFLHRINISFFVVDEAHCLSQWGHEFREQYRLLYRLRESFANIPIAAFTATATPLVQSDILQTLQLKEPKIVKGIAFRDNLFIETKYRVGDGKAQLVEFLQKQNGSSGIVYAFSRKACEKLAEYLNSQGFKAKAFHAGLESELKKQIFKEFLDDDIEIVVATIAFGMGIDKSNIRFVVHTSLPKSIEGYYQEIGRAGRDGLKAKVLLLYAVQDLAQQRGFIDELQDSSYKQSAIDKLNQMYRYASSSICRHKMIAKYFSDNIDSCKTWCDNCLNPARDKVDITKEAQMLLSAIYRTKQGYGIHYVVDILRGSRAKNIVANRDNELSVYGIGKDLTKEQWLTISDRLLEIDALYIGEFRVYKLKALAQEILKGKKEVDIDKARLQIKKSKRVKTTENKPLKFEDKVFEALRELRKEIAKKENIPPYIIFSDKTLKELSSALPTTKEQMLNVHGVGEVKFQRYGKEFLEKLAKFTL